ncbi:cobalt chelatase [Flexivirga sp. ID2601S]|uniref:Cobalt chelatase n=1 Tax=Flexivirga aerilata TaxID=1656889 RepID=A0A849APB5_9MICO|nr:cobalt chelatase [Flexivirga aerilata]NNG38622.1 cobalt chelatase [Flexivirga aerilata]
MSRVPRLVRRGEVLVTGTGSPVSAAHVATAPVTDPRLGPGVADAVAARLRHSSAQVHGELLPADPLAAVVVELAEQLRCESLTPATLPGTVRNLNGLFDAWLDTAHAAGAVDTELGLHVLTVAVLLRSRLLAIPIPAALEDEIEGTRFALAGEIGAPLRSLRRLRHDQRAFAKQARLIGAVLAARFPAPPTKQTGDQVRQLGFVPLVQQQAQPPAGDEPGGSGGETGWGRHVLAEYRVFTTAYDRVTDATTIGRADQRARWQAELDRRPRPVAPQRIARVVTGRLSAPTVDDWRGGAEEGLLDAGRLGGFIASGSTEGIFRTRHTVARPDTAVTLLLDCSGSMRTHGRVVATLVDTIGRGLDLAGIPLTVLGFSTVDWHGGAAARDWKLAGAPEHPGRLGGVHHLVLVPPGASWARGRSGLTALLRPELFAEGVDGEALQWAAGVVAQQDARRRTLVVISDGGPMSTATRDAEGSAYLDAHLTAVADRIEQAGEVRLGAIGIGADLSPFYRRTRVVDEDDDLPTGLVHAMLDLVLS